MPKYVRVLLIVGVAAAVPLAVWLYDAAQRDRRPPVAAATKPAATKPAAPSTNPPANPRPPLVGVASCAAGACHGAPASGAMSPDIWQSSAMHWNTADPHTKAYAALKSDLATQIMTLLKEPNTAATQAARCLACHTNPASANDPVLRTEGMNCASCHGNPNTPFGNNARFFVKFRTQFIL